MPKSDCTMRWRAAALGAMNFTQRRQFQSISMRDIKFGSDCSGADAAFYAGTLWTAMGNNIPINEMCSEAPLRCGGAGPVLFLSLNHPPKCMFIDLLARGHSGYCLYANELVRVPSDLDFYSAGTMCTDFSKLNTLNPKKFLGHILCRPYVIRFFHIPKSVLAFQTHSIIFNQLVF